MPTGKISIHQQPIFYASGLASGDWHVSHAIEYLTEMGGDIFSDLLKEAKKNQRAEFRDSHNHVFLI